MKQNDFIVLALCWNGASGVADGKPQFTPLGQNGFAILTCITFLVFIPSIIVPLTLLNSWLLTLYA